MKRIRSVRFAVAMAVIAIGSVQAQTTSTWLNTAGGNFTDGASWSNSVVPNNAAFFTVNGP